MKLLSTGKLKYHNIPLDTIIPFEVPAEYQEFSKEVIKQVIDELLKLWYTKHGTFNIPDLRPLCNISWRWLTKEGTLTTRLTKLIKSQWDLNIPNSILEEIGNIAKINAAPSGEVYFDITSKLRWESGDFGDAGSCFWAGRKDIRKAMIEEGNFYAIRFFSKGKPDIWAAHSSGQYQEGFTGKARSWLYEVLLNIKQGKKTLKLPALILFNSYGLSISKQSIILAAYLGLERGHCRLTNKGKTTGGLYVNGPGYVIGPEIIKNSVNTFDFGLDNSYDHRNSPSLNTQEEDAFARIIDSRKRMFKFRNAIQRKRQHEQEKWQRWLKVREADKQRGVMHQRYLEDEMKIRNGHFLRLAIDHIKYSLKYDSKSSADGIKEFKKKLDSLEKLYNQFEHNPNKIINHHIKNHLI